uniref:Uncharacterized protein n=1 Tax=Vibrio alginolyticus TaxID=663 RepID=A0A0P0I8C7_VIBAL|nr:hypothetical protein ICEValA056_068 [Vibrio alginolyticus]UVX23146.1 hypothetical protein [Proteus terrae subsp. cibarius]
MQSIPFANLNGRFKIQSGQYSLPMLNELTLFHLLNHLS